MGPVAYRNRNGGCAPKGAMRRCSSLIWNHQTSLLAPCLAPFGAQRHGVDGVNRPCSIPENPDAVDLHSLPDWAQMSLSRHSAESQTRKYCSFQLSARPHRCRLCASRTAAIGKSLAKGRPAEPGTGLHDPAGNGMSGQSKGSAGHPMHSRRILRER